MVANLVYKGQLFSEFKVRAMCSPQEDNDEPLELKNICGLVALQLRSLKSRS